MRFGTAHGHCEARIADLRAALAIADARASAAEASRDAILDKYHDLRTVGANPAPVVPLPEQVAKVELQEPDELKALIDVTCGRDYRKRAMMLAQLATDRAGGMDPEQIRTAIQNGVQAEGVP